jgi:peptidoglycan/LPS O-acetylase OafA/YrhL
MLHVTTGTTYTFPPSIMFVGSLGEFGVPVFFMISGFVVPLSLLGRGYTLASFPRFVLRRMMRLDPPYFATLALALLIVSAAHVSGGAPFPYHASDVALHVGYLSGLAERPWIVSTFWTLGIEFQYYILIGLALAALLPVARRVTTPTLRGPVFVGLLCAGFFVSGEIGRRLHPWLGDPRFGATWLTYKNYFMLGMAALIVWRVRRSLLTLIGVATLMFVWDHALENGYLYRGPDGSTIYQWLALVSIAAVVVSTSTEWRWTNGRLGRAVLALGTISYSLYITHLLPTSLWGNGLVVAVEAALCVGVAAVFYVFIERPAWRWSKRLRVTPVQGGPAAGPA